MREKETERYHHHDINLEAWNYSMWFFHSVFPVSFVSFKTKSWELKAITNGVTVSTTVFLFTPLKSEYLKAILNNADRRYKVEQFKCCSKTKSTVEFVEEGEERLQCVPPLACCLVALWLSPVKNQWNNARVWSCNCSDLTIMCSMCLVALTHCYPFTVALLAVQAWLEMGYHGPLIPQFGWLWDHTGVFLLYPPARLTCNAIFLCDHFILMYCLSRKSGKHGYMLELCRVQL